jgi:hypothetical protein
MDSENTELLLSSFRLHATPWLAMCECAGIWTRASLQVFASTWGFQSPRNDALATLSRALDLEMRTPAFLDLMQYALRATRFVGAYGRLTGSFG